MRILRPFVLTLLLLLGVVTPSSASPLVGNDQWECHKVESYIDAFYEAAPHDNKSFWKFQDVLDPTSLKAEEYLAAAEGFAFWSLNLMQMESDLIPRAAYEYHLGMVEWLELYAHYLRAYGTNKATGGLDYGDAFDNVAADTLEGLRLAEERCGNEWTEHFTEYREYPRNTDTDTKEEPEPTPTPRKPRGGKQRI